MYLLEMRHTHTQFYVYIYPTYVEILRDYCTLKRVVLGIFDVLFPLIFSRYVGSISSSDKCLGNPFSRDGIPRWVLRKIPILIRKN